MEDSTNSKHPNTTGAFVAERPDKEAPPCCPHLADHMRSYSSKLDESHVPLRTTFDGNFLDEDTGNWLILDTPPHDSEDRETASKNKDLAKGPSIGLPESKNGATGLDSPRARKPLGRLLRNKWYGFDRPPAEVKDLETLVRENLRSEMVQQREKAEPKVDMKILREIQKHYRLPIGQSLGGDWFEHALTDHEFWLQLLDKALEIDGERGVVENKCGAS